MRSQKLARGWLVALLSTSSAALSHALAGGSYPPFILWAFCSALAALVCVSLTALPIPRLALAGSVALSQLLFHTLYAQAGSVVLMGEHGASHTHHLVATHQHGGHGESPLMLVLHSLSAFLTYLMIRQADLLISFFQELAERPWQKIHRLYEISLPELGLKPALCAYRKTVHSQIARYRKLSRAPPSAMTIF